MDYQTLDPTVLGGHGDPADRLDRMLWRQLAVCCNLFGAKLTDLGRFGAALQLFKRSEALLEGSSAAEGGAAFRGAIKQQLRGFAWDGLAYYYFRRRKSNAAALYAQRAMRAHARLKQWEHVAKCHLHCGAVLALQGRHEDAVQVRTSRNPHQCSVASSRLGVVLFFSCFFFFFLLFCCCFCVALVVTCCPLCALVNELEYTMDGLSHRESLLLIEPDSFELFLA